MAHTATPGTFNSAIGGNKQTAPSNSAHKRFENVYDALAVLANVRAATQAFLLETPGHGVTCQETGPEGSDEARKLYNKTFGAL